MSFAVGPRRRGALITLLAALVLALGGLVTTSAVAAGTPPANTAPASIVVDSITSDVVLPGNLPGGSVPRVVVQAGGTFHVNVSFYDADGLPASFNKDTTLTIASNVGTLTKTTGTASRGHETATIDTALKTAVNQVVLTVGSGTGAKALTPGVSYIPGVGDTPPVKDLRFDVVSDLKPDVTATDGTAFQAGIGGDSDCTNATKANPVCEIVILPHGAGSHVVMSVGVCDPDTSSAYAPCHSGDRGTGGAVVQALFAQSVTPYTPDNPATIIVKCDKTLCGTGPIHDLTLAFSESGNGALADAGPCPAKGTTDSVGTPCVDYVQSKRDGSGDTHLYLLTPNDMRIGIG
jgi:hypothetical protein